MRTSLIRRCAAEAFGTFMLVAIGPGAVMVAASTHAFGHLGVSLAFGLAVAISAAFSIEFVFSAILAFVIISVATDDRTPPAIAPFALGATVFAGALVAGPLTGGSFNPARSFGPALLSGNWAAHWLYWIAPVLGMIVAMRFYEWLRIAAADPDARTASTFP